MSLALLLGHAVAVLNKSAINNSSLTCWVSDSNFTKDSIYHTVKPEIIPGAEICISFLHTYPNLNRVWYYYGVDNATFSNLRIYTINGCSSNYCNRPINPTNKTNTTVTNVKKTRLNITNSLKNATNTTANATTLTNTTANASTTDIIEKTITNILKNHSMHLRIDQEEELEYYKNLIAGINIGLKISVTLIVLLFVLMKYSLKYKRKNNSMLPMYSEGFVNIIIK